MRIDVVSIFPEYLDPLRLSLVGRAIEDGRLSLRTHDLRAVTTDRHRTVDDTPYGGGPGMVMRPEPWGLALDAVLDAGRADLGADVRPLLVVPTPSGVPFRQPDALAWSRVPWIVFACGRYEGIDDRVMTHYRTRADVADVLEVSLGDYVLAGGEVAVLVMVEAVARLLPGVLGNAASVLDDSFAPGAMAGLLEGPVYTKPPSWRDLDVPDVLRSGDHGAIARWRAEQARIRTAARRPDLSGPEAGADPPPP